MDSGEHYMTLCTTNVIHRLSQLFMLRIRELGWYRIAFRNHQFEKDYPGYFHKFKTMFDCLECIDFAFFE